MDTDLKMIKPFFQGAMSAFILTRLDDYSTFEDGKKWKEKVDLMCCLPNKFPLPILLLVNFCDKIDPGNMSHWINELNIETYYNENQYFDMRYISNTNGDEEIKISNQYSIQKDLSIPFAIIYDFVLGFNDIQCLFNENNIINGSNIDDGKKKLDSISKCIIV